MTTTKNGTVKNTPKSKQTLTPARLAFLELAQRVQYGRVKNLMVLGGEPVLSPPPRIVREVKLGSPTEGPPRQDDFLLKTQVVELFEHFDRLQNGIIECVEVKGGLPFRIVVEET